jgi:hypothetical protein
VGLLFLDERYVTWSPVDDRHATATLRGPGDYRAAALDGVALLEPATVAAAVACTGGS